MSGTVLNSIYELIHINLTKSMMYVLLLALLDRWEKQGYIDSKWI